ncbi:MAG: PorV/PorQ family protein [Elusimicrobiota bacterium]
MAKQKVAGLAVAVCLAVAVSLCYGAGGTSGAAFLSIIPGSRPAGMAGAFTGAANDVNSIYFNPAGLALVEKKEIGFTHNMWVSGINYEFVAGAVPLAGIGTVGAALSMASAQIDETKEATDGGIDITGKKLSYSDMAVTVGLGRKINDALLVGLNGKMVSETISSKAGSAMGIDAGVTYIMSKDIMIGAALQNLGTAMKLDSVEAGLPMTVRAGAAYKMMENALNIVGDINYFISSGKMNIRAGAEYIYPVSKDMGIAVRGGYQTTEVVGAGLTFGGGIVYKMGNMDIIADLAYWQMGDLGSPIRVSLNVKL